MAELNEAVEQYADEQDDDESTEVSPGRVDERHVAEEPYPDDDEEDDDETTQLLAMSKGVRSAAMVVAKAQRIHQLLGPGLEHDFYCRALALELSAAGISFQRDVALPVRYRGQSLGKRRVDFMLEDLGVRVLTVPIELTDITSLRTTLRDTDAGAALLLNFGAPRLELRRLQVRPGVR